jgi:FAD/FMN-containing dehydrogenase
VVEYAPKDLYLRAEAGMAFGEAQALASRNGLWWPVVHPWEDATLGGIVASNWNGPSRTRFGAIRDLVLGGVVVLPDSRRMRIGGKVVKNVAGYDLTKLHVGALGTLGVLTELNLKLAPLPARQKSLAVAFAGVADAVRAAQRAFVASLVTSNLLVFAGDRGGLSLPLDGDAMVVATAAGHPTDVEAEIRVLESALEPARAEPVEGSGDAAWCAWQRRSKAKQAVTLRLGVPASRLAEIVEHPVLANAAIVADVTSGVAWARLEPETRPAVVTGLQETARAAGGYGVLVFGPLSLRRAVDPWGHQPSLAPYMEELRRRWDPHCVLNPGRFVVA